jgi:DNA-binding HxlR family transcriptional regulator
MQDEAVTLFCLGQEERAFEAYNRERQRFQKLMRKPGISEEIMMESIKEIDQKESKLRTVLDNGGQS